MFRRTPNELIRLRLTAHPPDTVAVRLHDAATVHARRAGANYVETEAIQRRRMFVEHFSFRGRD